MATGTHDREWSNSFWGCCNPFGTCCMATWCPWFLFGKTKARRTDPTLANYSACNGNCLSFAALAVCGFSGCLQWVNRGDMRAQYKLKGSSGGDCFRSLCCPCCALIQEEKEMLIVNGQANEGKTAVGYQANTEGMVVRT